MITRGERPTANVETVTPTRNHWLPALLQRHFGTGGKAMHSIQQGPGLVGALINKCFYLRKVLSISADLASRLKHEGVASKPPFSSNVL